MALCGVALTLAAAGTALGADTPKLPDGPGKDVTMQVCGACHSADIVAGRRESRDGWTGVIEEMVQRGAKGSDEQLGQVLDYLSAHFSNDAPPPSTEATAKKVNVNSAPAEDLATVLGITAEQSQAIVKYRDSNGKFASLDDLKKVPGLDANVIDQNKEKIEF